MWILFMWKRNNSLTISLQSEQSSGHGKNVAFKTLSTKDQHIRPYIFYIYIDMSKSKKKGTVRINITLRCKHKTTVATEKQ